MTAATARRTTRLGFQIPNFNFPDVPDAALFERVAAMAGKAEESGFDAIGLERRAKVHADNDQGWMKVLGWLRTHVETTR